MSQTIREGFIIYVRYVDHVLWRNITDPVKEPAVRETIGWYIGEEKDVIGISWDRATKPFILQRSSLQSGAALVKNCILEIRTMPLQDFLSRSLSCWKQ